MPLTCCLLGCVVLLGCHEIFGYGAVDGASAPGDISLADSADAGPDSADGSGDAAAIGACGVAAPGPGVIAGQVFEDTDFAGGRGTGYAADDQALPNVKVELLSSAGEPIASTQTLPGGSYRFEGQPPGRYRVRVHAASLGDADTPPSAGFAAGKQTAIAEQTYECDGVTGNGAAGALGGESPTTPDSEAAATGGEHVVAITVGDEGLGGVDFGFSFALVINTNDAGQGSLRAFIENANAIARPLRSVFQIPDGAYLGLVADPGFEGGKQAVIRPKGPLPVLTASGAALDGTSQTDTVGDTNGQGPEIRIDGASLPPGSVGVTLGGDGQLVRGLELRSFDSFNAAGILLEGATTTTVSENLLVACGEETDGDGGALRLLSAPDALIEDNRFVDNLRDGINVWSSPRTTIRKNVITGSGDDGIQLRPNSSDSVVEHNTISDCGGGGIEMTPSRVTVADNTFVRCLRGIDCRGGTASIASHNTIIENDIGVLAQHTCELLISENRISASQGLGIDLGETIDPDAGQVYGVTLNDANDADDGPNDLLNFPKLDAARLDQASNRLQVDGHSLAGATIECFGSDEPADWTGHGEGAVFIGSELEGSSADGNARSSGDSAVPEQFRFSFTLAAGQLKVGDMLTCTASLDGKTSEFAKNIAVALMP